MVRVIEGDFSDITLLCNITDSILYDFLFPKRVSSFSITGAKIKSTVSICGLGQIRRSGPLKTVCFQNLRNTVLELFEASIYEVYLVFKLLTIMLYAVYLFSSIIIHQHETPASSGVTLHDHTRNENFHDRCGDAPRTLHTGDSLHAARNLSLYGGRKPFRIFDVFQ